MKFRVFLGTFVINIQHFSVEKYAILTSNIVDPTTIHYLIRDREGVVFTVSIMNLQCKPIEQQWNRLLLNLIQN